MAAPGPDPGQPFDWADYVAWQVAERGSLAAVAEALAAQRQHVDQVESVERALRRLRAKGGADGGVWGRRCLRAFGMPASVVARLRWMGHYHSRFTDLPVDVCEQVLRPWDRPPVAASAERAWVQLGLASVALRRDDLPLAEEHLLRAEQTAAGTARVEALLVRAYVASRQETRPAVAAVLEEAKAELDRLPDDDDAACLRARLVDHLGYERNRRRESAAAEALYAELPVDGPPFAVVRRHNGLGWSALNQGRRDEAVFHARRSIEAAGDGGYLRLRVMALRLLAVAASGPEAEVARRRAIGIAERLNDAVLRRRLERLTSAG
jgi:tetratricopeptide (TPR) repeat protein